LEGSSMRREERMFPASFTITEVPQYVITTTVASINLAGKKKLFISSIRCIA